MANAKNITKVIVGEELYYLKDKQVRDSIGVTNGIATLDSSGKVPSSQLPSYVDDVIDAYYYNDTMYEDIEHTIAITPETGKIYVDLHTSESYRWSGTTYIVLSSPYVLPTASANVLGGIKIGENLYIDENGVVSSSMYIPTLQTVPTPSTTTYEKDGKQIPFVIGQFARVVSGDGYEFYQVNDIKNNGTEVVWAAPSYLIPSVYSAPTAKILTYNTQPQELLNPGSTENGVIQYSSDGTNWSNNVPSATSAGDYIVYWKLIGDSTHTNVPKTPISVTIAKADITATAPTAKVLTYNTSDQELINEGSCSAGTMQYSLDDENWSTSVPQATNAGDYTVYWKVVADDNYNTPPSGSVSVNIAKATGSVTTVPTAKSLTYSGSALTLANAGSGTGTLYYSLNASGSYSTTIPSGTNAGDYTVYYYAAESANYIQSSTGSMTVTIAKATPAYTAPTAKSLTYNGSAQALVNAGSTSHGTIQYSSDNSSWSTSVPTATSAGAKTVYWKIVGDSNHTDKSSTSISVTIAKANQSAPTATGATTTYSTTATATASGGGGVGSIEWSNGNTQTSVGSKTTKARWTGNSNYNASSWSNEVTLTMNKANGSVSTVPVNTNYTYNGTARAVASAGSGTGTMYYRLGSSGSFSTTMPTMTNAGSSTLYYYAAASTNYNQSSTGSITVSVQKASQSAPTAYGATVNWGSTATATASGGGGVGSIEWSNGSTRTAIGSQSTQARWSGNSNYNASGWSNSVTLTVSSSHAGHAFVDFGLPSGTKWATVNIGASSETDYGNYYMYGKGSRTYNSSDSAYTGTENPLSLSVDTARQVWGGSWHMPTLAQIQELFNQCTWTWTTKSGINGYSVSRNGKSIFLPAGGSYYKGTLWNPNALGQYLTSTPYSSSNSVYGMLLNNMSYSYSENLRDGGMSVRPVIG